MAWTNISNALVAVGAKPFASTLQALRDNFAAMAAGMFGAPRIEGPAHFSPGVGAVMQRNCLPGGNITAISDSAVTDNTLMVGEATALVACVVRVTYSVSIRTATGGGAISTFTVRKNGTAVATATSVVTDQVVDITLAPGDAICGYIELREGTAPAVLRLSKLRYTVDVTTAGLI